MLDKKTVKKFGKNDKDTGSTSVQIAHFTERINKINDQGFLDSSTRKIFEDLNQSIKKLNTKNKK